LRRWRREKPTDLGRSSGTSRLYKATKELAIEALSLLLRE
jgi:hypothetical protein